VGARRRAALDLYRAPEYVNDMRHRGYRVATVS
jgi:hypothetical protein